MRNTANIFIGAFSVILFLLLILLMGIRFQILNKSFLFKSFDRHEVYAQLPNAISNSIANDPNISMDEKEIFVDFVKNISPQILKPIAEANISEVINYINGNSNNIVISFSLNGLGFENASSFRWSLSENANQDLKEKIKILHGLGNILLIVFFIALILIAILVISNRFILLLGGITVIALALISKIYTVTVSNNLLNQPEILQKILALLSMSIFTDIINTWFLIGGLLFLIWLSTKLFGMIKHKRAIIQEMTNPTP